MGRLLLCVGLLSRVSLVGLMSLMGLGFLEPAAPVRGERVAKLWRDVVEGESVEAKCVAEIVSGVLTGGSALARPGGGALPQPRRYVGVPRRERAPRAGLVLIKRETALASS